MVAQTEKLGRIVLEDLGPDLRPDAHGLEVGQPAVRSDYLIDAHVLWWSGPTSMRNAVSLSRGGGVWAMLIVSSLEADLTITYPNDDVADNAAVRPTRGAARPPGHGPSGVLAAPRRGLTPTTRRSR
jgi:hypothetical protein